MNGYVNKANKNKTLYTEEQIAQFEKDVLAGKEVDINEYVLAPNIDYSNEVSKIGESISMGISYVSNKVMDVFISFFSFLFN